MRTNLVAALAISLVLGLTGTDAAAAGACPTGSEAIQIGGETQCVHPDAVPTSSDRRTLFTAAAEARGLTCTGDGTSGNRLQAVYVTEGSPSLAEADRSAIEVGMINVESIYRSSSISLSDQVLVPRWVHDPDCKPAIDVVVVPAGTLASFGSTIQALSAQGFNRPDRKYIMWADSATYCGIASVTLDESKINNANDGGQPGYARTDRRCWGFQGSVVTHEVTHTLGAVLPTAPHSTEFGHCTDEYDIMCYVDGPSTSLTVVCPATSSDMLLDCNNDDYFHPDPQPGNWLFSHWNVADSSFLQRAVLAPDPSPVPGSGDGSTPPEDGAGPIFDDVSSLSPHAGAIGWLASRGITRGCGGTNFCPTSTVTRGQMAAFLHRYLPEIQAANDSHGFVDVSVDNTFNDDITWLIRAGITQGCGEASFCPDQGVTRGQMAAFLYRASGSVPTAAGIFFADVAFDHAFATEIAWLAQNGISNGCSANAFCPDDVVTREQMASFLFRADAATRGS